MIVKLLTVHQAPPSVQVLSKCQIVAIHPVQVQFLALSPCHLLITLANSLDTDCSIRPDLDPNCLTL